MTDFLFQPLLGAAGEIFGLLVTLVIIIIGALNQWLTKNAERRQREGHRPRPQGDRPQRPKRPRTPEDAVEEFRRRAHSQQ